MGMKQQDPIQGIKKKGVRGMQEIKCPKCGEVFQVDEAGYAAISKQVRDREFEQELRKREEVLKQLHEREMEAASDKTQLLLEQKLSLMKMEYEEKLAAQTAALTALQSQSETERVKAAAEQQKLQSELERKIEILEGKLDAQNAESEIRIQSAVQNKEKEILQLQNDLKSAELSHRQQEQTLRERYELELKNKDEAIARYRDFKTRLSTKMIGETLEQHCEITFNNLRTTAFPTAYFEKDNDAHTGSKGDYIFRDYDESGLEYISIMFEMKNEMETTATKKKNEDFFKELDKDRREKKCEYAVLVSMLEPENELYNNGIVDVSYRYPKMYVIRPQFFLILISILRNSARNSLDAKRELQQLRMQRLDMANFEENLMNFRDGFARNYELASSHFEKAVEAIDKSISQLEKTKKELLASDRQLQLANKKAQELTVKKLTKDSPSIRAELEALHSAT